MPPPLAETHTPRGLLRLAARLPIWLYRVGLGWLLGSRFLMLTHVGRKTGLLRRVVVEVVDHDPATDTYVIASGWGRKSDWYRNIQKTPGVVVDVGRKHFAATAVPLSQGEAEHRLRIYAERHPSAARALGKLILGLSLQGTPEDYRLLAESIPLVAFHPKPLSASEIEAT